jgi:hypothetical protein
MARGRITPLNKRLQRALVPLVNSGRLLADADRPFSTRFARGPQKSRYAKALELYSGLAANAAR